MRRMPEGLVAAAREVARRQDAGVGAGAVVVHPRVHQGDGDVGARERRGRRGHRHRRGAKGGGDQAPGLGGAQGPRHGVGARLRPGPGGAADVAGPGAGAVGPAGVAAIAGDQGLGVAVGGDHAEDHLPRGVGHRHRRRAAGAGGSRPGRERRHRIDAGEVHGGGGDIDAARQGHHDRRGAHGRIHQVPEVGRAGAGPTPGGHPDRAGERRRR